MNQLDELTDEYVKNDPTAFCSYEKYTAAKETLSLFCEKRAESIRKQLDGELVMLAGLLFVRFYPRSRY